jgi:hypothetical protein
MALLAGFDLGFFNGIALQVLTAVENGGAGRSKMVALGGVGLS